MQNSLHGAPETLLLERVSLLQSLPGPALVALAAQLRRAMYERGAIIFEQGDPGSTLYIVHRGQVKISLPSAEGRDVTLAILGADEFFGELSLMDELPRSARATALVETEVVLLSRAQFLAVLGRYPQISRHVLAVLSLRLRHTNDLIEDIVMRDLPARVARRLVALADQHGVIVGNHMEVPIPLTQEELAALVGVTRETLNKVLRAYLIKGWISFEGRHLLIHQPQALRLRAS